MRVQFPEFDLEDKVNFAEGGNVSSDAIRPPLLYTYGRKRGKRAKEGAEGSDVSPATS